MKTKIILIALIILCAIVVRFGLKWGLPPNNDVETWTTPEAPQDIIYSDAIPKGNLADSYSELIWAVPEITSLPPNITFNFESGTKIIITHKEIAIMSVDEIRDLGTMLNILILMQEADGEFCQALGEKLLPRFFVPEVK